jgi:hypothetical protein
VNKKEPLPPLPETDIYAVAVNSKGVIFAGSSPQGKVYRFNEQGQWEVYFEPKAEYIWSMVFDKEDNLYIATGTEGKIYKITGKNSGGIYYDSDETHILSLAIDKNGKLLAGSSDHGLLYRIDEAQKAVVLLECIRPELRSIIVSPDNTIYLTCLGDRRANLQAPVIARFKTSDLVTLQGVLVYNAAPSAEPAPAPAAASKDPKATPASEAKPAPAADKEKKITLASTVYRIKENGYPEIVVEIDQVIHSLLLQGKDVLMGSGPKGYLLKVDTDDKITKVMKFSNEHITQLINGDNGDIYAINSNPGAVYLIKKTPELDGTFESNVIDSGLFADWGKIKVIGKGKWEIYTRSGNSFIPDKSWNPWVLNNGDKLQNPAARYLQYRLVLKEGEVYRIEVNFLPRNQPPRITNLRILPPDIGFVKIDAAPTQLQSQTMEELLGPLKLVGTPTPDKFQPLVKEGLRTILWNARDPNSDEMRFKVYIRKEQDSAWKLLSSEDLEESFYTWDTLGWDDGIYYAKIEANDGKSNPKNLAKETDASSDYWIIDHTAPKITITAETPTKVTVVIEDALSNLSGIGYSYDGQEYLPLFPEDGQLDSNKETYIIERDPKKPLYIRAKDDFDNTTGSYLPPVEKK